jgi:hypothetical protein
VVVEENFLIGHEMIDTAIKQRDSPVPKLLRLPATINGAGAV